ncbi:MAG: hypothetical protein JKY48_11595 [Flavobacteriales bacterium]|nr:hypothetical protein [Flavobacteriales bacterium]
MSSYTISESEAVELTTTWRTNNPTKKRAFCMDKAELDEIFSNAEAVQMRVYLGEDESGIRPVMVGVDATGNDILEPIYDHATTCPTNCDESSVLNTGV